MDQQPKIDLARLGHKVRELRLGKGWTLADLARESGLSKAYISDVENGAAGKPNIQYIFVIARSLGVTLDELLHDATEKGVPRTKKAKTDLPPGLAELQEELQLSDDDVERLATVNFRGHRPRDKEGWRFLLETLQMLSQRKLQK
jgi:transcriptional regulator with XRE-family HTH domain